MIWKLLGFFLPVIDLFSSFFFNFELFHFTNVIIASYVRALLKKNIVIFIPMHSSCILAASIPVSFPPYDSILIVYGWSLDLKIFI